VKWLSKNEITAMVDVARGQNRLVIQFLLSSGLRVSEVTKL